MMLVRSILALSLIMLTSRLSAQDMPLSQVLIDGEGWQLVTEGYRFTDACAADAEGNFYFTDVIDGTVIYRVDHQGNVTTVADKAPRISGMQFGPDGKLYACQGGTYGRIVAFDLKAGTMEVVAGGVRPNDLVVTHRGHIYFTETPTKRVMLVRRGRPAIPVDQSTAKDGPDRPNGIALTPDQGTLAVSDTGGRHTWVWRIEPDGSLAFRQPYMTLRTPTLDLPSKGDGMTTDAVGRYYVTSAVGIQMFDPTGRMGGVIAAPSKQPLVSIAFAGPELAYLYVAAGNQIYRRKTKTHGFIEADGPVKDD